VWCALSDLPNQTQNQILPALPQAGKVFARETRETNEKTFTASFRVFRGLHEELQFSACLKIWHRSLYGKTRKQMLVISRILFEFSISEVHFH
jgi:hypothetical protein